MNGGSLGKWYARRSASQSGYAACGLRSRPAAHQGSLRPCMNFVREVADVDGASVG